MMEDTRRSHQAAGRDWVRMGSAFRDLSTASVSVRPAARHRHIEMERHVDVTMTELPILTEPLQLVEVERITGLNSKAARTFCDAVGGMRCGSLWQLPVDRMPWSYHQSRGANSDRFVPIPADNFDSELVRDGSDDGDTLTGMIPLLTERDAAIRLRVTLNDLNALLENGDLSYLVIGGEIRITDEDIRDLVRRTRTQESALPRRSDHECKLC